MVSKKVFSAKLIVNNLFGDSDPNQNTGYPFQNLNQKDLPGEIWKDIPDTDGKIQISNLGRIKSLGRFVLTKLGIQKFYKGRILKQSIIKYKNKKIGDEIPELVCTIHYSGNSQRLRLQRAVYNLFIGEINYESDSWIVSHKNNDRLDNRAVNLECITRSSLGKFVYHSNRGNRIYECQTKAGISKSADKRNKEVTQFNNSGRPINYFKSIKEAASHCKISSSMICSALKSNFLSKAGGCFWSYGHQNSDIELAEYKRRIHSNQKQLQHPVTQFNTLGKRLRDFSNIEEAANFVHRTSYEIRDALRGKITTCAGFIWRRGISKNDLNIKEFKNKIIKSLNGYPKEVYCISTITKKVLKKYSSISAAAREMNCNVSDITRATKKTGYTCKGYHWKF